MAKIISNMGPLDGDQSCRFCKSGMATKKVFDNVKNETSYLCADHLAQYNAETDSLN